MTTTLHNKPGYTVTEQELLQELLFELRRFTAAPNWPEQLPFEASRSFVMENLGNPVQWTIKLYQWVRKSTEEAETKLFLENKIQGTSKERWSSADGGFFISYGSSEKVAADINRLSENLQPLQQQLYEDYYGTFYNS